MKVNKGRRIESPSSINTYKQCPRKYHYLYVKRLPTSPSIHLVRGSVIHSVLEDFYDAELDELVTQNYKFLHARLLTLFTRHWRKNTYQLSQLNMTEQEIQAFFDESVMMLQSWFNRFKHKHQARMEKGASFQEAYAQLTPVREEEYLSEEYFVKGYIDAIHHIDDKVFVLDYKTSKNGHISPEYRLQLAIYALLYEEKHGRKPDYVGIDFLKSIEQVIPVDGELVKEAQFEIEQIHASTTSDEIEDYPMNPSPLCKWKSGQCDYYSLCFEGENPQDYLVRVKSAKNKR